MEALENRDTFATLREREREREKDRERERERKRDCAVCKHKGNVGELKHKHLSID